MLNHCHFIQFLQLLKYLCKFLYVALQGFQGFYKFQNCCDWAKQNLFLAEKNLKFQFNMILKQNKAILKRKMSKKMHKFLFNN